MKRRLWNYGYSYAASINATKLHQAANISEFWAGYNEYITHTQELKSLLKEIKDLRQAVFNCK